MTDDPELWPEPQVTPNAMLLMGYIGGAISVAARERDLTYGIVSMDAATGEVIIQRTATGNRYRLTVEQISGKA